MPPPTPERSTDEKTPTVASTRRDPSLIRREARQAGFVITHRLYRTLPRFSEPLRGPVRFIIIGMNISPMPSQSSCRVEVELPLPF